VNHTAYPATIINTGKDDISKINTYVQWREQTELNIWNGTVKVEGHTELGQFTPGLHHEPVQVFDPVLVRPLTLTYRNDTSVKEISTNRYMLDWQSTLGVNDLYFQSVYGAANMTSFLNAPIFLTNWEFVGIQNRTDMINGLNTSLIDEVEYNTVLDIEPTTGNTVQCRKRIQASVYFPPESAGWWMPFITQNNIKANVFYPLMKAGEYVTISDDLASLMRSKLHQMPTAKMDMFWVFVTVGPALALLGAVMVIIGIRRRKAQAGYDIIN
jgi:hypothetical protein